MLPALLLWLHAFPDKTICVGMRLPTSNGFWPAFGVLDTLWHALTTNFLFSAFLACIWTLDKFEMKFGMRCSLVMVNWHAFQDFIFGSEKICQLACVSRVDMSIGMRCNTRHGIFFYPFFGMHYTRIYYIWHAIAYNSP
jgi:hypothetical protein